MTHRLRLGAFGSLMVALALLMKACGGPTTPTDETRQAVRAFAPVQGPWTSTDGPGGTITALAVDPTQASTVYVRSGSSLFKTTNGGATWSAVSQSFPQKTTTVGPSASALLLTSTAVYVGGYSQVFKSTDGGLTWTTSADLSSTVSCSTGSEPIAARQVMSLARAASGTLYAGTPGGVFRSTDGGATWAAVGVGQGLIDPCRRVTQQFIAQLAADPATPTTVYAGGLDGLFKSTDGGGHWTPLASTSLWGLTSASQGPANIAVTALALNPASPTTLYFAAAGGGAALAVPAAIRVGPGLVSMMVGQTQQLAAVVIDTAGNPLGATGLTWASANPALASVSAAGLVSAAAVGSTLISATLSPTIPGLASITSNLISVTVTAPGVTGPPVTLEVFPSLASIQVGGTQQFAVTIKDAGGVVVNTLFLQSLSWTTNNTAVVSLSSLGLATGLTGGFATVTALISTAPGPGSTTTSPGTGGRFSNAAAVTVALGQVFRSTDGGQTWARRSTGLPPAVSITALAVHPSTPTTLYAGTSAGVYQSTDTGVTWAATGLQTVPVTTLAIDPQTPTTLYAGAATGLFKTTDGGATWSNIGKGVTTTIVTALAANPAVPTTLHAGTDGGGVFVTSDGGGLWSARSAGLGHLAVSAVALDSLAGTLYAGTWGGGAFRSTDGGLTWTAAGQQTIHPFVAALLADPVVASTAYAATNGGGVYKTTDGGVTWTLTGLASVNALSLAFDPAGTTTLYAGTTDGVFKSQDRGTTWTAAGLSGQVVLALARVAGALYAGTDGGGVFKNTNGGVTWTAVNTGLTRLFVFAVAVDPASMTTVYAGTPAGVFRSLNGGLTWAAFSDGLTDLSVQALALSGSRLYAGTRAGVFKAQ